MLAGVNGAGKSSIGGALLRSRAGGDYFNPDERSREILAANPSLSLPEANSQAWHEGVQELEEAIRARENFAFETTLGGSQTILRLLERAASEGFEVYIWYAGLDTPERHIERVRQRVGRGGHDIPEGLIRRRYHQSHQNLIRLLPCLTGVRVYDNSTEAVAPAEKPQPKLLLHSERGKILAPAKRPSEPTWAQSIIAAAFDLAGKAPAG